MSITETNDNEVEGSCVAVMHVDDSGTDPERTVLALATKDDLSVPIDEDNEDYNPGSQRRTRRYRTNNTVDLEVQTAIAPELEALELVGIADEEGKVTFAKSDREILEEDDEYVELAYFDHQPDFESVDVVEDSELLSRFADLELTSPEFDPSETPVQVSWTWWVEGGYWINWAPEA
ncbi:hypothetical protein [Halostagnicola sp. A-GB9-2]|uniref:hypothetical protein n=1 Tax=Halostagnicola sp. A-GB9-2 TaxID=3048066 RepID=UPI0024BF2BA3|nr:hypothetical protein [Halostagnicola sp. A-GB9-2]MDJ1434773.1 hypothetical protein [Halostagnicola sp. A-GB9-2]